MRDVLELGPVLLLGASGYLGRVVAARLLIDTPCRLLLPVRAHHQPADVAAAIAAEDPRLTLQQVLARTDVVVLPSAVLDLLPRCRAVGVRGIINCAGSVSYYDRAALTAGNEALTVAALELGKALEVEHFTYLSTAFASGYREGVLPEALHDAPTEDPTDYTASKRACEHLVAESGLPWLIARPAIVIGDSQTGHYSGRPYGIYQLWRGFERLLSHEWQRTAYGIGSDSRLQLVHQDAVADGVIAALRQFESGRVLHLVSDPEQLPTVRQAWQMWFDVLVQPEDVRFFDSVDTIDDVLSAGMSKRQRVYLDFSATNLQIAERDWRFQTEGLASLGLPLPVASAESLRRCMQAYLAQSPKLQAYLARLAA